jgi:hypothetical protein
MEVTMGGTVMMQFDKGEIAKLKALNWDELTIGPSFEGWGKPDFWVEWGSNVLKLGYSFGGPNHMEWAQAIAHELCKRFKIIKGGWDAVGYCKDINEFKRARAFSARINPFPDGSNKLFDIFNTLTGMKRLYRRAQNLYESEAKRRLDLQLS